MGPGMLDGVATAAFMGMGAVLGLLVSGVIVAVDLIFGIGIASWVTFAPPLAGVAIGALIGNGK